MSFQNGTKQYWDQEDPGHNGAVLQQPVKISQPSQHLGIPMQFMSHATPRNVPPGLEYLATLDSIFIRQDLELIEIFLGCEMKNRYNITSSRGELLFKAKEETDFCVRYCCGPIRPFDLEIKNPMDQVLIHLERPLRCGSFCFPCCGLQEMNVYAPLGVLAGSILQKWSIFPKFEIKDAQGETVLKIEGPLCTCSCTCGNVDFKVLRADGVTEVGKISKQWSGLLREAFTDADNFGITFPMDLTVQMKAVLIGACFLIDYNYFEKQNN